ncbi:MAG: Smr/MutS family protein [Bacteroidales bacterium]|jgi:DNA-nicking Smr family endonuclease
MGLKKGDKVRFLNTTGGGIIVKQLNSYMVLVEIEDGFEVPVLMNEVVKIGESTPASRIFLQEDERKARHSREEQHKAVKQENKKQETAWEVEKDYTLEDEQTYMSIKPDNDVEKGIYLGWFPIDVEKIQVSDVEIVLFNYTNCEIIYSIFLQKTKSGFIGYDYGTIPANNSQIIDVIKADKLDMWQKGEVQIIFFHEKTKAIQAPHSVTFNSKISQITDIANLQAFPIYKQQKGIIHTLYRTASAEEKQKLVEESKYGAVLKQKNSSVFEISPVVNQFRIDDDTAEVDLHISKLLPDFSKMKAKDILQYQLSFFDKVLSSAIAYNYKKLIVIHGIGNGVLKNAILNRVSVNGDIEVKDAPFAKYGYGAVELYINY